MASFFGNFSLNSVPARGGGTDYRRRGGALCLSGTLSLGLGGVFSSRSLCPVFRSNAPGLACFRSLVHRAAGWWSGAPSDGRVALRCAGLVGWRSSQPTLSLECVGALYKSPLRTIDPPDEPGDVPRGRQSFIFLG